MFVSFESVVAGGVVEIGAGVVVGGGGQTGGDLSDCTGLCS